MASQPPKSRHSSPNWGSPALPVLGPFGPSRLTALVTNARNRFMTPFCSSSAVYSGAFPLTSPGVHAPPAPFPASEPLSAENPTCYAHSQHLKLNIAKTQLISTTKSITPPAFSNSININTHLHVQAKTRDIILISSFPYFQFPVHRQTLSSIPSKHVILFQ